MIENERQLQDHHNDKEAHSTFDAVRFLVSFNCCFSCIIMSERVIVLMVLSSERVIIHCLSQSLVCNTHACEHLHSLREVTMKIGMKAH